MSQLALKLRDEGMRRVTRAAYLDPWLDQARTAIRVLAESSMEFTAEDIRRMCGDPDRPNLMGALFLQAAKADSIAFVGYEASERAERRGAPVKVWRGVSVPRVGEEGPHSRGVGALRSEGASRRVGTDT